MIAWADAAAGNTRRLGSVKAMWRSIDSSLMGETKNRQDFQRARKTIRGSGATVMVNC